MTDQQIIKATVDAAEFEEDVWTDYDGSYQPDDYDADGNIADLFNTRT